MDDAGWASVGRALADALMKLARERGDAEKKYVAELNTEICRERRVELAAPPPAPPPDEPEPVSPPPKPAPAAPSLETMR